MTELFAIPYACTYVVVVCFVLCFCLGLLSSWRRSEHTGTCTEVVLVVQESGNLNLDMLRTGRA